MAGPELPCLLISTAALLVVAWRHQVIRGHAEVLARQMDREKDGRRMGPQDRACAAISRIVSPRLLRTDRAKLQAAGIDLPPEALWIYRIAAASAGSVLVPAVAGLIGAMRPVLLSGLGAGTGLLGVEWWLRRRTKNRSSLLRRDWPGFLHRLRLCLLAGMPLPSALEAIVLLSKGQKAPLYLDLIACVRKVKAGLPPEAAIAEWAQATGCSEVSALAGAVERSRSTGMPLGATVEAHHRTARSRHRLAYLTWLNALPSRLSVVAMVFFLPAILIIVLVPNVIAFLRAGW